MKKAVVFLLLLAFVLNFSACETDLGAPVRFCYLRDPEAIRYGSADGVLAWENRDLSGSREPEYLLTLYFSGPLEQGLVSPFPEGTATVELVLHQRNLILVMNQNLRELSGVALTEAYACIAQTCFSLMEVSQVTILIPEFEELDASSITLTRDSVALLDDVLPTGANEST